MANPCYNMLQGRSTKQPTIQRNLGGSRAYTCNISNLKFSGSYIRTCSHLLHIARDGVQLCQKLTLEKRAEMTILFQKSKMGGKYILDCQMLVLLLILLTQLCTVLEGVMWN